MLGKSHLVLLVTSVLVLCVVSAHADAKVYVIKEADGTILFSSKPPKDGRKTEVFTSKGARYSFTYSRTPKLRRTPYKSEIALAHKKFGVDKALIRAVIHAESSFNPRAVSRKGALGLMQIMPFNLKRLSVRDAFDPKQNIHGGTKYLSDLLKRYKNNIRLAVAAYNAGEGAVDKYNGIPPFTETKKYVRRVMQLYQLYQTS